MSYPNKEEKDLAKLPSKKLVSERLTTVEIALGKLDSDYKATTNRQNRLIADYIQNAREELNYALDKLINNELAKAFEIAAVAWLQVDFARRLLEAEEIEHLLGESDYLELNQLAIPWEGKANELMDQLLAEILKLRDDIEGLRK